MLFRALGLCATLVMLTAAAPGDRETLWVHGDYKVVAAKPGSATGEVVLAKGAKVLWRGEVWGGVRVGWRGSAPNAPELILLLESGGNCNCGSMAVIDTRRSPVVRTMGVQQIESVTFQSRNGVLTFGQSVEVGALHLGAHVDNRSSSVPMVWRDGAFRVDMAALTSRPWTAARLAAQKRTFDAEMRRAQSLPDGRRGYPGVTESLLPLILSGHADRAHAMLVGGWPAALPGRDKVWSELCYRVTREEQVWPALKRGHLPHADMVEAAAARWNDA